jgi:hypothetical protein
MAFRFIRREIHTWKSRPVLAAVIQLFNAPGSSTCDGTSTSISPNRVEPRDTDPEMPVLRSVGVVGPLRVSIFADPGDIPTIKGWIEQGKVHQSPCTNFPQAKSAREPTLKSTFPGF